MEKFEKTATILEAISEIERLKQENAVLRAQSDTLQLVERLLHASETKLYMQGKRSVVFDLRTMLQDIENEGKDNAEARDRKAL